LIVRWFDGSMVGWLGLDGWMVGWFDGWMVGWLDGLLKRLNVSLRLLCFLPYAKLH